MKVLTIPAKKGQVFTWDLAISISVFLIVLAMLFYMWNSTTSKATQTRDIYEMETISVEVTEQLIRTAGIPRDWENTSKYAIRILFTLPFCLNIYEKSDLFPSIADKNLTHSKINICTTLCLENVFLFQ